MLVSAKRPLLWVAALSCAFVGALLGSARAEAADISGQITSTVTLLNDSQLVGDVTCLVEGGPCIALGASDIAFDLNGFTISGPASPPENCAPSTQVLEDGIAAVGVTNVLIEGPGLVQNFRRHGIFVSQSSGVTVQRLVSSHHCYSGLQMSNVEESNVLDNISVRNAIASGPAPCGGTCVTNSNNNRFLGNIYAGNGSIEPTNNDFGLGLVGTSRGNLVEGNTIGGNANGILIQAGARDNVIRRNVIVGNPAIQVSATAGATIGWDIQDLAPAGANLIEQNRCITYSGAGPAPCPNLQE